MPCGAISRRYAEKAIGDEAIEITVPTKIA